MLKICLNGNYQKLLESKGISDNIDYVLQKFDEIMISFVKDFINYHDDIDTLKKLFLFPKLVQFMHFERYVDYARGMLKIPLDHTQNTADWLSDNTAVNLDIVMPLQKDFNVYRISNRPSGIFTSKDDNDPALNANPYGFHTDNNIYFFLDVDFSNNDIVYAGNTAIDISKKHCFVPYLRHEMNHLHKKPDYFIKTDTEELQAVYSRIVFMMNKMSGAPGDIAYYIYRFCFGDEANAHVEQFYAELKGSNYNCQRNRNDFSMSDTWTLTEYYLKKLTDIYIKDKNYIDKIKKNIYKNFKNIADVLFHIKENENISGYEDRFYRRLISKIRYCVLKNLSKMKRAAKLLESNEITWWDGVPEYMIRRQFRRK